MAQKSKKNHIVETALPLFLQNGFKGTSIDLVVKVSEVSKPTVYNHFPDKAALMLAVIERWVATQQPQVSCVKDPSSIEKSIKDQWLNDDAVDLYALVIGEGRRFPLARQLFWQTFDTPWRRVLIDTFAGTRPKAEQRFAMYLDQQLLSRLRQL
jgi:TetR/AcrR family transcriptional regulator of autoinduction and epiphytic fitness